MDVLEWINNCECEFDDSGPYKVTIDEDIELLVIEDMFSTSFVIEMKWFTDV